MSSQIVKMFEESNRRMRMIMEGKFKPENIAAEQKEFEVQIKLLNAVVSAFAVTSKNVRAMKDMQRMNLLSATSAIDVLSNYEDEKVCCPEQGDKLITRQECLDFSGINENIGRCQNCENFGISRRMLMPNV